MKMVFKYTRHIICGLALASVVFSSCKDEWESHNEVLNPDLTMTLNEKIHQYPDISVFVGYLEKTGYDKVIASSKTFTVWAPSNTALQSLDASIVSDSVKLREFVAYHISNQSYRTVTPADSTMRLETLSGKFINFSKSHFEEASITTADQYARNGVLHIIDKPVESRKNIWEYIRSSDQGTKERAYLESLNYIGFDSTKAIQIGVDPRTGNPVYQPGSGDVQRNAFFDKVADLSNEEHQYTFFLLSDNAYTSEYNKLTPFYKSTSSSPDSTTDYLSNWNVVKDLVVNGLYTPDELNRTLISPSGARIPVNTNAIMASFRASNGIVYIVNSLDFALSEKIPVRKVEGEFPASFSRTDMSSKIFYRYKLDSLSVPFRDIEVYGTAVSQFYIRYRMSGVPSCRYKIYWRAVSNTTGDNQTAVFNQRLAIGTWDATTFPYKEVPLKRYAEVYLGEYEVSKYGKLDLFLVSAASTTSGANTLILDYLKFEPVLQ